jgi:hypothetical protein
VASSTVKIPRTLRAREDAVRGAAEPPDEKAAEAEAVKVFGLTEEQRKRLSIWEWHWS